VYKLPCVPSTDEGTGIPGVVGVVVLMGLFVEQPTNKMPSAIDARVRTFFNVDLLIYRHLLPELP
jgi:hypothetical protein